MPTNDSLFSNAERAATPVIGIILVVALAVILSSVTLVLALGIGEDTQEPSPNVGFEVEKGDGTVTFIHNSGEELDGNQLSVSNARNSGIPETVNAGDRIVVEPEQDATTITLNYHQEDSSMTLQKVNVEELSTPIIRTETADGRLIADGTTYSGKDERPLIEVTNKGNDDWEIAMFNQSSGFQLGPTTVSPGDPAFDPEDAEPGSWDDTIPTNGRIVDVIRDDEANEYTLIISPT